MISGSRLKEQYYLWRQLRKFRKCHGYELDLENPRSYNEKIVWRKIYDRNPLFPVLMDKYRSRDLVGKILGDDAAGNILIPLLFSTENPEEIPFDDLPEEYIVKPNHGSGWYIIVDKEHRMPRDKIISKCRKWMKTTYGQNGMEWAYSLVRPLIMVEQLLKDSMGRLASDFKFHVFHGKVVWVFVMHDRFGVPLIARYDRDFNRLLRNSSYPEGPDIPRPENFEKMVHVAEELAGSMDYLRVDLYNIDGKVFFGEFTIYPGSGFMPMGPEEFDRQLGECWHLDRGHARDFEPWF